MQYARSFRPNARHSIRPVSTRAHGQAKERADHESHDDKAARSRSIDLFSDPPPDDELPTFDIDLMDRLPVYSEQVIDLKATNELPATPVVTSSNFVRRNSFSRQNSSVQRRKQRERPKPDQIDYTFGMGSMLMSMASIGEEESVSPKSPQAATQVASHQFTRI